MTALTTMDTVQENSDLRSCFICYLCRDFFRRPRILPCGHTFCNECLARIRDEIISDGQADTNMGHVSSNAGDNECSPHHSHSLRKTLSPEGLPENGSPLKNHDDNSNCNGKNKESTHERKESSSCVDDLDNVYDLSQTCSPPEMSQLCPTSNSHPPAHCKNKENSHEPKQHQREVSPGKKTNNNTQKTSKQERNPSMFFTGQNPNSRTCSHCGSMSSSPLRDSATMRKSSSPVSFRDKSPSSWTRDNSPRWNNSSPNRKSAPHLQPPACSFEHKHGREMEPFVCPIPECNYSMRVMNLARWSPKNKSLANALASWKRLQSNLQDSSTQTDISNSQSVLLTIPRSLVADTAPASSSSSSLLLPLSRRKRHSSMIDIAIDQAVSMDGTQQPAYHPRGHYTWRSYAAMVGMNILQQILNL